MLRLPAPLRQEIEGHARDTYPRECCGFLIGTVGDARAVSRVHRLVNRHDERAHDRYEVDPLDWVRVERTLSEADQVIGVYHSHPDHPSQPSEFDRERAHPSMSYLIVSVCAGDVKSLQSWQLHPDTQVFEEEFVIQEAS